MIFHIFGWVQILYPFADHRSSSIHIGSLIIVHRFPVICSVCRLLGLLLLLLTLRLPLLTLRRLLPRSNKSILEHIYRLLPSRQHSTTNMKVEHNYILFYIILYYNILYRTVLYCTVLYYPIIYNNAL